MPIIVRLKHQEKVQVETMDQSGRWFRNRYKVTPSTTFAVTKDVGTGDKPPLCTNRIILLWANGHSTDHGKQKLPDETGSRSYNV